MSKPQTDTNIPVAFAKGDGIGPEIMDATLRILDAAQARIDWREIKIGEQVYKDGHTSGIAPESWNTLRDTKVFLKAPITTPQGGGYKSLNVTIRKTLGLFANVRPFRSYYPFIETKHHDMNLVIVRENEEDTYAGIEHQQTDEVTQCLKLISRPGCERIIHFAFNYARRAGRRKVTCMTKDNIMKLTDGMFHKAFDEIAKCYPDIETEHHIIDIGAAHIAAHPERFDVVVTPNLYGDIISDVAAEVVGSVGLAGSANIGEHCAMFEAIHGSAPDIAGKNIANPSALIQAAVIMLNHLGQSDIAECVANAKLKTIEDGYHTTDIYSEELSKHRCGTDQFTEHVIERLGEEPKALKAVRYGKQDTESNLLVPLKRYQPKAKANLGCDVFIHWDGLPAEGDAPQVEGHTNDDLWPNRDPEWLAAKLNAAAEGTALKLRIITNRGVKVYPDGYPETFCTDHWRCRFVAREEGGTVTHADILALLQKIHNAELDFIKTEHLCSFDGERAYSLGQGE